MIKLFQPYMPQIPAQEIQNFLQSGQLTEGPLVKKFEEDFINQFRIRNAVAVNSGTSALELAYELIGLGPGDEVITTPLTCTATNMPLLRRGCKIIWADINQYTLCISWQDVIRKITPRTRAVVQVHLGGIDADIGRYFTGKIPLVSDAAQALGIFNGDYTCCSFQAIKHITTGDGGMLCCAFEEAVKKARLLRWFGIDRNRPVAEGWASYRERMMTAEPQLPGTKRHMNDLAAFLGIHGLLDYEAILAHRRKLFNLYNEMLHDITGITLVKGECSVYWLATVLVEDRDNFAKKMYEAEIEVNLVQVRNDIYPIFGGQRADLPYMNAVEDKYVSLPLGMHVSEEDVQYICDTIKKGW